MEQVFDLRELGQLLLKYRSVSDLGLHFFMVLDEMEEQGLRIKEILKSFVPQLEGTLLPIQHDIDKVIGKIVVMNLDGKVVDREDNPLS